MRRTAVAVGIAACLTSVAACSGTPDPRPVAEEFADALAAGDFSEVSLIGASAPQASEQLAAATEGMGEQDPAVEVTEITTGEGDTATVGLQISWRLDSAPRGDDAARGGATWTYPVEATLGLNEDGRWEVAWSPAVVHPELAEGDALRLRRTMPERADVLGAEDTAIVTARTVFQIGIDKTRVNAEAATQAAAELAGILDIDADALVSRTADAGERAFVEAIVLREDDAAAVRDQVDAIAGAVTIRTERPLAPTRSFARPLLGTVGEATAEIVEDSDGAVQPGDQVGLSGLQAQYDDALRGEPGFRVERVSPEDGASTLHEIEARSGEPLRTTLDVDLQSTAEQILADVGPPGAIVALRPSTGEVLAAASGSGGEGYSTATLGQYAPGSTFKVVSALALLRAGVGAEDRLDCAPTATVDGRSFENYDDYPASQLGEIPLRAVIAHSCNTALIGAADTVSQPDLVAAAAALGLGEQPQLGFAGFLGDVPEEAGSTEHAASMIGQGRVLASPLGMATVAASVAAGQTVVPRLVEPIEVDTPEPALTADEADQLQTLMRAVVEEGSGSFLADVPGEPVGAKTGTAEYGTESPPATHAWMIATHGDLAVAVFVADGASGSATAGPLLEGFLTAARQDG